MALLFYLARSLAQKCTKTISSLASQISKIRIDSVSNWFHFINWHNMIWFTQFTQQFLTSMLRSIFSSSAVPSSWWITQFSSAYFHLFLFCIFWINLTHEKFMQKIIAGSLFSLFEIQRCYKLRKGVNNVFVIMHGVGCLEISSSIPNPKSSPGQTGRSRGPFRTAQSRKDLVRWLKPERKNDEEVQ